MKAKTSMRHAVFYILAFFGLVTCFGVGSKKANAQQDPQFTQYMFNELTYNPGFAGNNRTHICANFLQHSQWTGFDGVDGGSAPNTQFFTANAPLSNKYVQGVGLSIFNDQVGFQNTVSAVASGSHHLQTAYGRLSLGINAGIIQTTLNGDELDPREPGDDLIPQEEVSNILLDLGFGAYLQAKNYYAGVSVLRIPEGDLGWTDGEGNSKYQRHFYLTGGYNYKLNESWDIKPSTLVKFNSKVEVDLNGRAVLNDKYWGGLGYRVGDESLNAMLGLYITPKLKFGYSFDLPFDPNNVKTGGTHEFLLGYCFRFNPQPKEEFPIWSPRFL